MSQNDDILAWASAHAWRDDEAPARKLYGELRYAPKLKRWAITGAEPHVAIRMKRMFARIAVTQVGEFTFPDTDESCAELDWFLRRYPLEVSGEDRARLAAGKLAFERVRDEIEQVLGGRYTSSARLARLKDGVKLRANQTRAIEVARRLGRLLIADDVGLGKTHAALGCVMAPEFLPVAIMVQPHMATQWIEDFIHPYTTLSSHLIGGTTPYPLPDADAYVFKYSNAFGWVDLAATGRFRSLIFDEIQEIRHGPATNKGAAARVFAQHVAMRIGLSATPIFNYGGEMFSIIDVLDDGALGTREEFIREWCTVQHGHIVVDDPDALGTYLRERHLIVRTVGEGPPPNRIIHDVPYDEKIVAADEALARQLAIKVLSGSFTERGQAARELDMMARRATGLAKARHVAAFVKILLEAKTPIILGGWHRDVYDIWLEELKPYKPILYTGSESVKQKDAAKRAFMQGETDCLIMSLRSGAGLDGLQHRCGTVVHGELDWSREVHKQLAGRLRPHARADAITEIYLIANGGSDPLIAAVQGLKASQARGIVDPLRGTQTVHSDESRIQTLARMYLEKRP